MSPLRIVCLLLLCLSPAISRAQKSLLDSLDHLVNRSEVVNEERRTAIDSAWVNYHSVTSDADRYNVLRGLYENYRSYRIDSAIIVADMRLRLARRLADRSKMVSATLNLAEGYVRSGAAEKAIAILDTLDTDYLQDYHRKYRNSVYRNAYELKSETALLTSDRLEAIDMMRRFRDDAEDEGNDSTRAGFVHEAERLRDAGMYGDAVAKMEQAAARYDFSSDPAMLYTLGDMYISAGQRDKAVDCLARSAILDLSSGKKEYRSLILLASILFEEGQVERAFEYINCAFDDANFSNATLRTTEIMKSMPLINRAFHEAERQKSARTRLMLIFTVVASALLLLALILAIRAYRVKRKMIAGMEGLNRQLEAQNERLSQADSLKLKHINQLLMAYAGYISRLKTFRKSIMRLLRASQYEKALDAVAGDKEEAHDIAVFQEMFDRSFLSMYPDFIEELNRYMKTPVELRQPDRLTPELRIAAMMKIGITSTSHIAKMLHYSPQTVYNLRSTLRTMITVDWDEFETYLKPS